MQWISIFDSSHFQFLPNGGGLEIRLLATLQDTEGDNIENLVLTLKTKMDGQQPRAVSASHQEAAQYRCLNVILAWNFYLNVSDLSEPNLHLTTMATQSPLSGAGTVTHNNVANSTEMCMVHPGCSIQTTSTTTVTHIATQLPRRQCVRHGYLFHQQKVRFWLIGNYL